MLTSTSKVLDPTQGENFRGSGRVIDAIAQKKFFVEAFSNVRPEINAFAEFSDS